MSVRDFGLVVNRSEGQAGNFVTDLSWTHVLNIRGYNIYRAENPSDDPADWYQINNKEIHVNYYQDRGFSGGRAVRTEAIGWFYKVIPVMFDGSEFSLSESKSVSFELGPVGVQQFVAPTIRSRTNMLLDPTRFSSAEVVNFLCRKWAGEYCTCVEARTRRVDANCQICFGTGFVGGYELIEGVYCRVRSSSQKLLGGSGGVTVAETTTGIISSYPLLNDADILIKEHNVRYRLRDTKQRATQGYVTAQTFSLEKMQLYDMGYRIPVPAIIKPTRRVNGGSAVSNVLS